MRETHEFAGFWIFFRRGLHIEIVIVIISTFNWIEIVANFSVARSARHIEIVFVGIVVIKLCQQFQYWNCCEQIVSTISILNLYRNFVTTISTVEIVLKLTTTIPTVEI